MARTCGTRLPAESGDDGDPASDGVGAWAGDRVADLDRGAFDAVPGGLHHPTDPAGVDDVLDVVGIRRVRRLLGVHRRPHRLHLRQRPQRPRRARRGATLAPTRRRGRSTGIGADVSERRSTLRSELPRRTTPFAVRPLMPRLHSPQRRGLKVAMGATMQSHGESDDHAGGHSVTSRPCHRSRWPLDGQPAVRGVLRTSCCVRTAKVPRSSTTVARAVYSLRVSDKADRESRLVLAELDRLDVDPEQIGSYRRQPAHRWLRGRR